MIKTAEFVSLGHPDKTADYITSYVLDRLIEQDKSVKYGVEVMIKGNTVALGGEVMGHVDFKHLEAYVKEALREIGYDERYAGIWGKYAIDVDKIKVINLIGVQSPEINQGVERNGWGDQGVFVGYACKGIGLIPKELYVARKLNNALYQKARSSEVLGLDIKTQITLDNLGNIETAIVAIPMLKKVNLEKFVIETLGETPANLIINGTGAYTYHSAVADAGITGRKLACDFYSTACPIGGGSPWTKDATKADLTLNLYARDLAKQYLEDNDECFVYLSSCIGRSELVSSVVKTIKDDEVHTTTLNLSKTPFDLIEKFNLRTPKFAQLCREGLIDI